MTKTYILDTNILLSDPHSMYSFEENNVIIPLIVLEELDKFKNRQDDVGKNSRFVSRELDKLRTEGNLLNGIKLKVGGVLKVVPFEKFDSEHLDKFAGLSDNADNQILLFAKSLSTKENNIVLVSKDVNVRLKADSIGLKCEDYFNLRAVSSVDEFYTGVSKISLLTDDLIQEIYQDGKIDIERFNQFTDYIEKDEIYPNQIVILKNDRNVNPSATSVITKYDAANKWLKKVAEHKEVYGLKPKNKEQKFALDLLMDDHIKLVTLMGPSGTGKTLMALVAGLEQLREVGEHGKYDKLIITRPVQSVGREIGFLPGPQPLDAKVLTPDGWVEMGSLNPGDFVIARDGTKSKIENVYPKGEKEVYKIRFSDNTETECCDDHLWLVKHTNRSDWNVKSLKEIREINFYENKIEIPLCNPILDFNECGTFEIEPYTFGQSISKKDISIPNNYLFSTIQNRLLLLQGLMDSSGFVSKNGSDTYFKTNSKDMSESIGFLARSLGAKVSMKKNNNRFINRISINDKNLCPFKAQDKANKWHPINTRKYITEINKIAKKQVQCIKIDNPEHLYITDEFIVTHNTLSEKMEPWISPIKDNLSFLLNSKNGSPKRKAKNAAGTQMPSFNDPYFDILREQGKIEVEAISFIRGRSLPNAYIIVEESQNLSVHELKTILTRVGHGTKIVLTGDIEQIDDSHLDIFTNGLSHCVQKFKDVDIAGHVTLIKGERSELATISSKILGA